MLTPRHGLAAVLLVSLGVLPSVHTAQADGLPAPQNVQVRLAPTLRAPDALSAGRYRLDVKAPAARLGALQLVKPNRGYTRADFRADTRGGFRGIMRIFKNIRFFGGTEARPGREAALWETMYSGEYWLMGGVARPGGMSMKTIRVHGTPQPTSFPTVTADALGSERGLRLDRSIPPAGRMLVRNTSQTLDTMVMLPLRKGATYADFLRSLRRLDSEPPVRFRGARATALSSPDVGYVLRYRLNPGGYVVTSLTSLIAAFETGQFRRMFQPLTVRGHQAVGTGRTAQAHGVQGFTAAPGVARRIQRWAVAGNRNSARLAKGLANLTVRRDLIRWAAPKS